MNKLLIDNIIRKNNDLDYVIKNDEEREINYFNDNQQSININITQENNSIVFINLSSIIKEDTIINIITTQKGNNNKLVINARAYAYKGFGTINVESSAKEKTSGNIIIENLKGLSENGSISLNPILKIDTKEVDASHNATVGKINEDDIFYLESKGISRDNCYQLLKNSFIYGLFSNDFKLLLNRGKDEDE